MNRFDLRPLASTDVDFAYSLETDRRWRAGGRLAGRIPSLSELESVLWRGVYAQFVVTDNDRAVGLAALREPDYLNQVASAYVVTADDSPEIVGEAAALFDFAFGAAPFRKLYDESPDIAVSVPEAPAPSEALLPQRREGLLREHYAIEDEYRHKPILSVSRDDWRAFRTTGRGVEAGPDAEPWSEPARPASTPVPEPLEPIDAAVPRPLLSKRAALRPIAQADYESLLLAELDSELGPRWRHRGATPSPESFVQNLWAGVLAQFLIIDRANGAPVGIVSLYNPDPINGYAHLSLARLSPSGRRTLVIEGLLLFLDYVFTCWPFRKLYAEALAFNFDQFSSGAGRTFNVEARMSERVFYADRMWDELIVAITRRSWAAYGQRLLAVVVDLP